VKHDIIIFKVL